MRDVSRRQYERMSGLAAMLSVGGVLYLAIVSDPGRIYPIAGHLCWVTLGVLTVIEFCRKRFIGSAVYAAGLITAIILLGSGVMVADGLKNVRVRLIVHSQRDPQNHLEVPIPTARVSWSSWSDGRAIDAPWTEVSSSNGRVEFQSEAQLRVAEHHGYFVSNVAWYFDPALTVLIVSEGGRKLRFAPDALFSRSKRGPPPDEISTVIEIDDYLKRLKRPPAIEWPHDSETD